MAYQISIALMPRSPVSKLQRWFKDHGRRLGRSGRSALLRGTSRDAPSSPSSPSSPSMSSEGSLEFTPESPHTDLPSPVFPQAHLPNIGADDMDAANVLLSLHHPVLFSSC